MLRSPFIGVDGAQRRAAPDARAFLFSERILDAAAPPLLLTACCSCRRCLLRYPSCPGLIRRRPRRCPLSPIRREELALLRRQLAALQKIRPSLPRSAERLLSRHAANVLMVPGKQHLRHARSFVTLRPRVVRTIEQSLHERILRRRLGVVQHTRALPHAPHRSASAPEARRPTRRNRRSRSPRRLRARTTARRFLRTGPPPAPYAVVSAAAASSATRRCVSGLPDGDR